MDSKTILILMIAPIGLVAIIKTLYETDSKKREGFIQMLVLLSLGSLLLVLVNELDNILNKQNQKWSGPIIFLVFTVFSFIYGYRKNGKSE